MEKQIKEVFYNPQRKELLIIYSDKTSEKITGEKARIKFKKLL